MLILLASDFALALILNVRAAAASSRTSDDVLKGLREFYRRTARPDGSFQPGIDPDYLGMSDSAYSDLAAVTYACTIHKTFGWKLPHEEKTIEFLLARQQPDGEFFNVAGTVDPDSPQGRTYNTTQALVALRALGVKPKYDPLPVFEEILKQDYKTLPAYSTSFFPLAYLCAGKPIPEQADRAIRALMVQDDDGYLNDHVAATFHASHYYRSGRRADAEGRADGGPHAPRPEGRRQLAAEPAVARPARDVRRRVHAAARRATASADCQAAIERAAQWALSCRNADGGFGHFPGSTSDADAVYFQVGTLVMAGFLQAGRSAAERSALARLGPPDAAAAARRKPDTLRITLPAGSAAWRSAPMASSWPRPRPTASLASLTEHPASRRRCSRATRIAQRRGLLARRPPAGDGQLRPHRPDLGRADGGGHPFAHRPHRRRLERGLRARRLATSRRPASIRRSACGTPSTASTSATLPGHKSWVNSVAFTPGQRAADLRQLRRHGEGLVGRQRRAAQDDRRHARRSPLGRRQPRWQAGRRGHPLRRDQAVGDCRLEGAALVDQPRRRRVGGGILHGRQAALYGGRRMESPDGSRRVGCGFRRASRAGSSIRAKSCVWRSRPTASTWQPAAATGRRACGS